MSVHRSRQLRRNGTDAERRLWSVLRDRRLSGVKFRRQQTIGPYIADFVCFERPLIVEADGGQHTPEADAARTRHLEGRGFRILRFWNSDVLANTEGVLEAILAALAPPHPAASLPPSPARGEG